MTTSGTYDFNPSLADFTLNAYALVGIGRTDLKQMHLQDARLQANFLLTEWSNRQVNLWTVDLQEFPLAEGVATYELPITTIAVLDAYVRTGDDTSGFIDRIIFPVSRTDYAALPNKGVPAQPTQFWFDRQITPNITLWQVPDADDTYTLRYYRCRQIQDAVPQAGTTMELPYRWLDAFNFGLAARLAAIYAADKADGLDKRAERAWQFAATQDTERVAMSIIPGLSGYFR